MIKRYDITGMTCTACSSGIERTVSKLNGVTECEVSLMSKSLKVEFDESVLDEQEIFSAVKTLGYGIFNQGEMPEKKTISHEKLLFIRFIISVVILVPLMYVSMGGMFGAPLPEFLNHHSNPQWFALYQLILSTLIVGINYQFFKNGFIAVIKRVPNMDTLVALGSGVSFIYSLVLTVFIFMGRDAMENAMNLHFESAATILALVTVGKWLEEKSKRKTGDEINKLLKMVPDEVTVEVDGKQKVVALKEIKEGDIIVVKQGEYIPVDGKVIFGNSFVDKCAITGESMPVEVAVGDTLTSASIVKSGIIKMVAERVGEETTLSKIINMVREAGASKAPIQKFADKVAGIFVPIVTAISILTFAIWILIDGGFNPSHSVTYAISVLVVSCPCALGLATPVAIMTATGKAASLGILYKDAESLQKVCDLNSVLLDKTATITEGKPKVNSVLCFEKNEAELLKIACGIEKNSNHPLAKCVVEYVIDGVEVENFAYHVGKGAYAEYNGKKYLLGNSKLLSDTKITKNQQKAYDELSNCGNTVIMLAENGKLVMLISIADPVKEGSQEAIELLKNRHLRLAMLTGDSQATAFAVAASVGIDEFVAEVLPEDKLTAVKNVQAVGGMVAMVGDGINDSPALKQADIGIAMGSGTDVAIDSADIVLVSEDLRTIDTVFDLSRATVRNIKENLFWAFFYNVVMIPVAAGAFSTLGFVFNPMIAAACMSLSSLFVVFNALRLLLYKNKRFKNKSQENIIENNVIEHNNIIEQKNLEIENKSETEDFMKTIVTIEGMCCEHCAKRVEEKLSTAKNVVSIDVKLKKNIAVIRSREELSTDEITALITDAGYKVVSIEQK